MIRLLSLVRGAGIMSVKMTIPPTTPWLNTAPGLFIDDYTDSLQYSVFPEPDTDL